VSDVPVCAEELSVGVILKASEIHNLFKINIKHVVKQAFAIIIDKLFLCNYNNQTIYG